MTIEDDLSYLPLRVVRVGDTGKRTFDAEDKRRLIEACRRPGVSLSGMALKAGVNANQLYKWVHGRGRKRGQADEATAPDRDADVRSAFVPVVAISDVAAPIEAVPKSAVSARREAASPALPAAALARLTARLPNGVTLALECRGQDAGLVKAMIEALGAR
ncbi:MULTISPECIES: IS66-like element accessory protein TnpA [Ralstonia solanacearum species complex]|uniref:Transposase n=1 Tax=Ralstonia solanacearum TaxID=305 RepID=A0A0S4VS04_RALSL|nr:transposase [Ralstonia pseudosolanacearum]CUV26194.1 transposase [Ralstonia solanacearum]CUV37343.1 transposase [Ralstonia solanacearum]CUV42935.1 transposase [Ralstonia solanacearum]CUV62661.1 transposase [Ralstonia solanacearum]